MRRFKVLTWGLIADGSTDLGDFEPFVSSNLFLTAALGEVFAPLLFSVDAMVVVVEWWDLPLPFGVFSLCLLIGEDDDEDSDGFGSKSSTVE